MYEGEWVAGIQHGIGRMMFPNGTQKEGYFEKNVYRYPIKNQTSGTSVEGGAGSTHLNN